MVDESGKGGESMKNFFTLCKIECIQIAKSMLYYLFIACLILFYITQMGEYNGVTKPKPGAQSYGFTYSTEERLMMEMTTKGLLQEFFDNQYKTYPFGFLKNVVLSEKKQGKIGEIIEDITGYEISELRIKWEEKNSQIQEDALKNGTMIMANQLDLEIAPLDSISFQEFCSQMEQIDELIGGGSDYQTEKIKTSAYVPKTYEQALSEYEELIKEDGIGNAYARQFCDYMGILLAILPVFLAVSRGLRDRRAKAVQVIDSKQAASSCIILSRYLSTIVMALLPLLLLAISPTLQTQYSMKAVGQSENFFTLIRVVLWWLTPTILLTVSVGFFFTELTKSASAILVQGIWWFLSINSNQGSLTGMVGFNLIPRFNSFGNYNIYQEVLPELIRNRVMYTAIAILLIVLTIGIYHWRRKGGSLSHGALRINRKNQL